ncbi:aspartate/glutamate racemase family protein [Streptomyces sp. NPDC087422]|uniref:aspartate/glutamate racemase family protein n=1 Tax=Streptomyces sp. NPDC087422 TaxID=3365786 RepID=UPI00380C17E9
MSDRPVITMIHTVTTLPPVFTALAAESLPHEIELRHIVDDSLLSVTRAEGGVRAGTARRLLGHVWSAADAGADFVLVTCSSLGEAVELTRPFSTVPVLRIDERMAEEAVRSGPRIGVIATLGTTLAPTANLIRRAAEQAHAPLELVETLCVGAFEAQAAGDPAAHDALVREALGELIPRCDVIVLAQASMSRIVAELDEAPRIPVLASPRSALEALADRLRQS